MFCAYVSDKTGVSDFDSFNFAVSFINFYKCLFTPFLVT
jgi:hypothetical protein